MRASQSLLGIVQGRLSPQRGKRLQFFPHQWQSEFEIARRMGFDCIEWNLDREDYWMDPLWAADIHEHDPRITTIKRLIRESGVPVFSICLDYFMTHSLIRDNNEREINTFQAILQKAFLVGSKIINVPLHEEANLEKEAERKILMSVVDSVRNWLEVLDLTLVFESELPVGELHDLVTEINNPRVGICYDTGNMVSMGYDLPRDIRYLGPFIKEVHIKDRRVGSSQSVYLGTGDVDFESCCEALADINFRGPIILQAWREGRYLDDAKWQLEFVKDRLRRAGL